MISSTIFVQKAQPQEFVVRLTLVFSGCATIRLPSMGWKRSAADGLSAEALAVEGVKFLKRLEVG